MTVEEWSIQTQWCPKQVQMVGLALISGGFSAERHV
jgi:hypothetical protein